MTLLLSSNSGSPASPLNNFNNNDNTSPTRSNYTANFKAPERTTAFRRVLKSKTPNITVTKVYEDYKFQIKIMKKAEKIHEE